jgi:hypothetical protein
VPYCDPGGSLVRDRRAVSQGKIRHDDAMPAIPDSTKNSVTSRAAARARERWPKIEQVNVRFKGGFGYLDAIVDGDELKLCRLKYAGYANLWGFAIYRASHNDYQPAWLPSGTPSGTVEDALDTACGLYLNDPTAWT